MNLTEFHWSGCASRSEAPPRHGRAVEDVSSSKWKGPLGPSHHIKIAEECPVTAGMLAHPRPALRA
eukprot:54305-Alexandrium_andersonii.AAC.1